MKIKLINRVVIITDPMPLVSSLNGVLPVEIENYNDIKGNISIRIDHDNSYDIIKVNNNVVNIPFEYLCGNLQKVSFTVNGNKVVKYVAPAEFFKVKAIYNLKDSDKLVDLLALLYNKYIDLSRKVEELEDKINEGDLLI